MKFAIAMLPILWLIVALSVLKMKGHIACLLTLGVTLVLGIFVWKLPAMYAASGVLEGILNGLWPICLVIISALFTYNLTVETKAMDKIKQMLGSISPDARVLAILIGWGFGNFMEGMAGFGTAVAIPASMMVGAGLAPVPSVVACLVVNSTPTCFGSVGVPTQTLCSVTGLTDRVLVVASNASLLQALLTFLSPFFMVIIVGGGIKALKGMLPLTLISSVSFLIPQFIVATFVGPELPNIIGSIISMACIIGAAKVFNKTPDPAYTISQGSGELSLSLNEGLVAWSPFILIFVLLLITSNLVPPVHDALLLATSKVSVYLGENPGTLTFNWLACPGVTIFVAAFLGGAIQKASIGTMFKVLFQTLYNYRNTILTICSVMSVAKIMGYSGMISVIAQFLVAATGSAFPLISPLIGGLGGFVTGSGTSTCVLFGPLQVQTAGTLGLNQEWIAAANVAGAGIGKMISPQGIAIGTGAAGLVGKESEVLGKAVRFFILYVAIAGVICMIGA
ncbi:MAG: L-lactate permease [Lachnospiraceae bacterium]|nr:L-lactate permease [Lachnospiraceae bacterium]